jgi:glycosyltransferase involved in cell wall biosynthesis
MRAAGLEVDVLCTRRASERRMRRDGRGLVLRLPGLERRRAGVIRYVAEYASFFATSALALTLLQPLRRYRLVYVTNLPDALVFAAAAPKLAGARIVFDVRECTPEMLMDRFGASRAGRAVALMTRVEQAAIRFADAVVTCTQPMRDALCQRGADPGKVTVTLNVGPARLRRPAAEPDGNGSREFRLVTHGTIIRRYGHEVLIRAMRAVAEQVPNARLEILGDGPLRPELERLSRKLGLESHVRFGGFVDYDELVRRLLRAHCGVVPVLRNPESDLALTMKMFEYLDLGLPVVASRTTAVDAYFNDGEVRLTEPGDPGSLAQALVALARDHEGRRRLAESGHAAFERYAPERQRERYVQLFERLLSDV